MRAEFWFILVGFLLAGIAVTGALIKRLPMTTAMVYFAVGIVMGPHVLGLISLDPIRDAGLLERFAEIALVISLFTAGLQLRLPLRDSKWRLACRLAFVSMTITIVLAAVLGVYLLALPWGAAVVLGAAAAPTDPVLASEVQVDSPFDQNRLRFGLTGEAGLNDGTALPFVMLGLALLGGGSSRAALSSFVWDLAGAAAGLAIGFAIGTLVGRHVLHLRIGHGAALGYNDFLALGVMGITYGVAQVCHANGFLAVFASGYAVRGLERRRNRNPDPDVEILPLSERLRDEISRDPEKGPQYLAESMLVFDEHYERVAELALVVLIGVAFSPADLSTRTLTFAAVLLVVIRPISVAVGTIAAPLSPRERRLAGWLGLRGIGSIYYLSHALTHGVAEPLAAPLAQTVFTVVATSIVVHGFTATPLMARYHDIVTSEAGR